MQELLHGGITWPKGFPRCRTKQFIGHKRCCEFVKGNGPMPINADITFNLGPSIMYRMLGQGICDNMVCSMLIPALLNDIVADHIMPKVMELIIAIKAHGAKILRESMRKAFLCIYKYIGIN